MYINSLFVMLVLLQLGMERYQIRPVCNLLLVLDIYCFVFWASAHETPVWCSVLFSWVLSVVLSVHLYLCNNNNNNRQSLRLELRCVLMWGVWGWGCWGVRILYVACRWRDVQRRRQCDQVNTDTAVNWQINFHSHKPIAKCVFKVIMHSKLGLLLL
jgi:hypothetical protein